MNRSSISGQTSEFIMQQGIEKISVEYQGVFLTDRVNIDVLSDPY